MPGRAAARESGYTDFNWITKEIAQGAYPGKATPALFGTFDVVCFTAYEKQIRLKPPSGKLLYSIPLDDDSYRPIPPELSEILHQLGKSLASHVRAGKKALITCAMGANRSGLITGLTMMYAYGFNGRQAVTLIKQRRKPHEDVLVLGNPIFEAFLLNARPR